MLEGPPKDLAVSSMAKIVKYAVETYDIPREEVAYMKRSGGSLPSESQYSSWRKLHTRGWREFYRDAMAFINTIPLTEERSYGAGSTSGNEPTLG